MNGPHDLGGQMGFGPVEPEQDEPCFHADWQRRALGLTLCAGAMGCWTLDESRHARESLHPAVYYTSSYYEIWVKALKSLLLKHDFVAQRELELGEASSMPGRMPHRVLKAADVPRVLAEGTLSDRPITTEPRFGAGDSVRVRNIHPEGHTRLPRYVRGKVGRVERVHGGFVFPDTNAHGQGENPQRLYTVVFEAVEIWGSGADSALSVSVDAWESYLEPA